MTKIQAHYPEGQLIEEFEHEDYDKCLALIDNALNVEGFKFSILDDNGEQTGPSVKFSEL